MTGPNEDWTISIFVPETEAATVTLPDPSVETHSLKELKEFFSGSARIQSVDARQVQPQWANTIDRLMKLTSSVSNLAKEWTIEEIEVGLTLSAKGELLFIAEAGAEASIKFKLTRKSPIA